MNSSMNLRLNIFEVYQKYKLNRHKLKQKKLVPLITRGIRFP